MAKFRYRIDGGRYGGECAMGTVTDEFAKYWAPKIEEDGAHSSGFIDHVLALADWDDDDGLDPESPNIFEDGNETEGWYAIDDKEHINAAFADGGFVVTPVPTDGSDDWGGDWENEMSAEAHWLKGREGAYISTDADGETPEGCTPVMIFMSVEKGGFASWFLDTDEEFDEKKLVMTVNETHMGEFVEDLAYDKVWLEANYDMNDTMGKSYEAAVGWSTDKWRDEYKDPESDENMSDYWEEYDDEFGT